MRRPSSGAPEVTASRSCRSGHGIRRHCAALPAEEVTIEHAIPVTTVPRTLFDLAAVLPVDVVERALREAERLRLDDALSLDDLLIRHPRRRGAGAIRECLRRRRELPGGVTREELEERFVAFLDRSGLPRPRLNAWLMLGDRRVQVDCLWAERSVVVELDGHATHGTRIAFEEDRDRDRRLEAAGCRVVRITWRQLHDAPGPSRATCGGCLQHPQPSEPRGDLRDPDWIAVCDNVRT
jgi:hypothetical protein